MQTMRSNGKFGEIFLEYFIVAFNLFRSELGILNSNLNY
jgi:hypothetical protein